MTQSPQPHFEAVPFVDLFAQYLTIKGEIDEAIASVIRESAFIRGPHVEVFEEDFAAALGVRHCISCANGTDALFITMHALGLQPGDEVITTAHSWIATSETITLAGGRVVFCDTDRDTFTIDPTLIEAKITPRTRGIIPVHLYGQPADMDPIIKIARRHGLWVIEDCAQAHFAHYKGRLVGTFGVAATFSFYPGKNLGAMGDAGCIVTDDEALATRMAMFARHGGLAKGDHQIEGVNSRLDGMQAAILNVKQKHLGGWTAARQRVAAEYDRRLGAIPGISIPPVSEGREQVYHVYAIRTEKRDALRAHLAVRGIQTMVHYPTALPFLPAYRHLGHHSKDFPVAFAHQSRVLSLPIYPEMAPEMIDRVVSAVAEFAEPEGMGG